MTDRLGEALAWYDEVFGELDEIDKDAPRRMKHIAAAARNWQTLTNPTDELIDRVARSIAQFFETWCDDAPYWPTDDLYIHDHDIRVDARAALVDALTDTPTEKPKTISTIDELRLPDLTDAEAAAFFAAINDKETPDD